MVHIPDDKRYFRIGEASRIIGVEPYVLRFWESEFPQIRPERADSKQRTYQKKDLEVLLKIKRLLYEEKMTIQGAKQYLAQGKAQGRLNTSLFVEEMREDLYEILKILT